MILTKLLGEKEHRWLCLKIKCSCGYPAERPYQAESCRCSGGLAAAPCSSAVLSIQDCVMKLDLSQPSWVFWRNELKFSEGIVFALQNCFPF